MTKYKNILNIFLTVIIAIAFITPVYADQHAQIERRRREASRKVQKLKALENLETNKMFRNQRKLDRVEKDLSVSKNQYTNSQLKLVNLSKNLEKAQANFASSSAQARKRIVDMYKKKHSVLLEVMLNSQDINDLLDKIYYQNQITKRDKYKMQHYREQSRRISSLKYQVELEKQVLQRSIKDIDQQQKDLQGAISRNASMIQKLQSDRLYYERTERELARQSANLRRMISMTSSSNINISTGFLRPVGGPITSSFGSRVHPIFKSRTFHSGIDIGAPYGSPVRASNSGKVIFVGWYGGYGKVVIIDHGRYNGVPITTLYAHLSSFNVGVGSSVVRGQQIGRVGSTGYSTGPHLHFEVRCNGEPRNPLGYV